MKYALLLLGAALGGRALLRHHRHLDLRGRTALVTGGGRGLGLEIARVLAERGARLALLSRSAAELERAASELRLQTTVETVVCDVTDRAQVEAAIERLGPIDVLVNNAGVIQSGPLEETTLDDFDEAIRTHFWGPLYAVNAVLPQMRKRRQGRVVNIASIGGRISVPHLVPYSASKFALVGLSEGLRAELVKDGIYVTTVCPGLMRTGSHLNARFKGRHRQEAALFSVAASTPLTSISSERAARQIVDALQNGDADLVLSPQAKLGALVHGLMPGLTADLFGLANRFLPGPGGIGKASRTGAESTTPSALTKLGDEAAVRNNELPQTPIG